MNDPRCDMGPGAERCRNQAAGWWHVGGRRLALCDDCRSELAEQLPAFVTEWEPIIPDPVRALIAARILRMAAGWFG